MGEEVQSEVEKDDGRKQMNLEQRERLYRHIQMLEGLLAYAVAHNDEAEAARLRAELTKLVEKV